MFLGLQLMIKELQTSDLQLDILPAANTHCFKETLILRRLFSHHAIYLSFCLASAFANIIICPESWIARWTNNIHFLHGENILWLNCLLPSQSLQCVLHVRDVKWSWAYLKAEHKLASKWKQLEGKHFQMTAKLYQLPKVLEASLRNAAWKWGHRSLECDPPPLGGLRNFPGGFAWANLGKGWMSKNQLLWLAIWATYIYYFTQQLVNKITKMYNQYQPKEGQLHPTLQ